LQNFTQIPNIVLRALMKAKLNGSQRRIIDVIIAKTYGYHRETAEIKMNEFAALANIERGNASSEITKLCKLNIVKRSGISAYGLSWGINQKVEQWFQSVDNSALNEAEVLSKKTTPPASAVVQKDNTRSPESVVQKDNSTSIKEKSSTYSSYYSNKIKTTNNNNPQPPFQGVVVDKSALNPLKPQQTAINKCVECILNYISFLAKTPFESHLRGNRRGLHRLLRQGVKPISIKAVIDYQFQYWITQHTTSRGVFVQPGNYDTRKLFNPVMLFKQGNFARYLADAHRAYADKRKREEQQRNYAETAERIRDERTNERFVARMEKQYPGFKDFSAELWEQARILSDRPAQRYADLYFDKFPEWKRRNGYK
jgi:phage replication O-like protein O